MAKKTSGEAKKCFRRAAERADGIVAQIREAREHNLNDAHALNLVWYERKALELSRAFNAMAK